MMNNIKNDVLLCLRQFIEEVCGDLHKATPEAVAVLPEVAKLCIMHGISYSSSGSGTLPDERPDER